MPRFRSLLTTFVLFLAAAVTRSAENKSAAPETKPGASTPVVEMSPYEVAVEKVGFKDWLKVSSPNYILYTDTNKREATALVRRMEMMRQAVQFYLRRKSMKLPPVVAVLPTERSDWNKIRSRTNVKWEVASSLVGNTRSLILIESSWEFDHLETFWAMIGAQQIRAMNLHGPFWFDRGLMHFFETVTFTSNSLTIGRQGPMAIVLHGFGWMDWPEFYGVTYDSPEFLQNSRDHDRYEAQCEVLTHYVLTNSDAKMLPLFLAWAAYIDAGNSPTDASFKDLFQTDWKVWQNKIDDMLHGGTYTTANIKFPPAALQFPVTVSEVGENEMRDLFVVSQILNQQTKESDDSLSAVLKHGMKTPLLREFLPDACATRDRPGEQMIQLRAIIEEGSTNPIVYSTAAKLLFKRSVPVLSLQARVKPAEAGQIRAWCDRALELEPMVVDANETLAWTCALSAKFDPASLETIANICRKLDGTANTDECLLAMAVARWRNGNTKQAHSLAERVGSSVFSRTRARDLAKTLIGQIETPAIEAQSPSAFETGTKH